MNNLAISTLDSVARSIKLRTFFGRLLPLALSACGAAHDPEIVDSIDSLSEESVASPDDTLQRTLAEPMAEWPDEYMADDGTGLRVLSLDRSEMRRLMTSEERAMIETYQRKLPAPAATAGEVDKRSQTERTLDEASKLPPDMPIEVAIELEDQPFDFARMQGASETSRANLIDVRRAQLANSQSAIEKMVTTIGGEVLDRMWLVNVVDVRLPAGRLPEVAKLRGVVAIGLSGGDGGPNGWTGQQIRAGMMLDGAGLADGKSDFYSGCGFLTSPDSCHDGRTGNYTDSSQRVRIAIIEWGTTANNLISRHHVGWKDTPNGPSRVVAVTDCNGPCGRIAASSPGSPPTHGTTVTWVAAGSIEEGQDSAFPMTYFLGLPLRTTDQRARSGVAKEAHVYYYISQNDAGIRRAIERAVEDDTDIINMSFWLQAHCSDNGVDTATFDVSSINVTLRNAINAGVLPVAGAGNENHHNSKCTLSYPSWRPHVLNAGALNTSAANPNMNSTGMWDGSSRGGAFLRNTPSGPNRVFSGIDLVASGCFRNYFSNDSNGYSANTLCGTSNASPAVAGTVALLRDAFQYVGWTSTANDARRLLTNMLLFGDAWDANTGSKRSAGTSNLSGFGRVHAHWPSTNNLTAPWGWGSQAKHINEGEVLSWTVKDSGPENPAITQWKWAMTWFDNDLSDASNIVISVVDTCVSGLSVALDWSYDFRKRIHLRTSQIANRCLEMRAWAIKAPPGGVTFYTADYYHSGNADEQH